MKKYLLFLFLILLTVNCASNEPKSNATEDKGVIDLVKEKAESEEGKQYIQKAKEKLSEKETQDKIKGFLKKDTEKN